MKNDSIRTVSINREEPFLDSPSPMLTQQLDTPGGFVELSCQYLHHSFSVFKEDIRFCHAAPLISRLILVEQGRVNLEFPSGGSEQIGPGDIYLLPSNHPFYTEYRDHCVTKGFHLYLRDRLGLVLGSELPDVLTLRSPELANLLQYAIREGDPPQIHAALMVVLVRMLRDRIPNLRANREIPPACLRVIDRLRKTPSLELHFSELADEMHISLASLSKQFKHAIGQTMRQYRERLVLEKARRLLEEPTLTAGEIAAELGFADLNYFFVFFRKAMKTTPLAYRKDARRAAEYR